MTTLTTTCQIEEQLIFFFQDVSIIRQIRIFRLIMFLLRILKKYKNYLNTKVVKKTLFVKYPCDNFSQNPLNPINVTSGHLRYARMKPFILSPSSWNQAVEKSKLQLFYQSVRMHCRGICIWRRLNRSQSFHYSIFIVQGINSNYFVNLSEGRRGLVG